jgi:CheY-like chemotaxis protein
MYKILLIDDEVRKRERLEFFLDDMKDTYGNDSVSLTHATDADSGLRAVKDGRFGLIMLDYLLGHSPNSPKGTSLIPHIKQSSPDSKIWMYTSFISKEQALEAGADDLMNPLEPDCYNKFCEWIEGQLKG